jgi:hypothetical protein
MWNTQAKDKIIQSEDAICFQNSTDKTPDIESEKLQD